MNRLLFVQIYSCREAKVVAELRYRLKSGGNINWAYAINTTGNTKPNCANVYLVSYSLE